MAFTKVRQHDVDRCMDQLVLHFDTPEKHLSTLELNTLTPITLAPEIEEPTIIKSKTAEPKTLEPKNSEPKTSEPKRLAPTSKALIAQTTTIATELPPYDIIRSRRRTLGITVHRAKVEVRAPLKAPKYWINNFISEKKSWICAQVAHQTAQLKNIYQIVDGATIPLLDKEIGICVLADNTIRAKKRASIHYQEPLLTIQLPTASTSTEAITHKSKPQECIATRLFMRWIKVQAANYMSEATQQRAASMGLAEQLSDIKYRRTSSKWGHCTSDGVIQYNPLIMLAPQFVVDYIIAHEVCHLKHANHSKTYWALVDRVYSNRIGAEKWLKTEGYRLAIETV